MTITYGRSKASTLRLQAPSRPASVEFTMPRRAVMNVRPGPQGLEIHCPAGRLWLTQTGDGTDHVVQAGGTFRTASAGLVVVQALGESTLRVADP